MIALSPANHNDYLRTEAFYMLVVQGKGKKKNELELSKKTHLHHDFKRGERLGVLQGRREVVIEHWEQQDLKEGAP